MGVLEGWFPLGDEKALKEGALESEGLPLTAAEEEAQMVVVEVSVGVTVMLPEPSADMVVVKLGDTLLLEALDCVRETVGEALKEGMAEAEKMDTLAREEALGATDMVKVEGVEGVMELDMEKVKRKEEERMGVGVPEGAPLALAFPEALVQKEGLEVPVGGFPLGVASKDSMEEGEVVGVEYSVDSPVTADVGVKQAETLCVRDGAGVVERVMDGD